MIDQIVVADADALIALTLEKDSNHEKAIRLASLFAKKNVEVVFPATVFPEAITSLVRAANQPQKAHLINQQLQQGSFQVDYPESGTLIRASQIFESSHSKQNTFFDAIVVATAEKLNTKTIFSFDNWYSKLGFISGVNLLPPTT